ncbi:MULTISPECIES: hypothetical protein [Pseudomonas]|uniref:Uncharacterized protein n=1 Tax=Pseudomonas lutea TaxID=243924 RepID=A0A9X8MH30_9PSED|nr:MULTISPECIES: hypothetical protein [Pseudomonas]SER35963.1 hypothetical protein SAMN05216409_11832 [Pseudomonas lutea]
MNPLLQTFQNGDVEQELAELFTWLHAQTLKAEADEINVYGAPHLGSIALIQRHLTQDGLVVLNNGDEDGIRYLFKAWRYRNPRRGLSFLRTYLQVLFGSVWSVDQMYQKKSAEYPTALKSANEIDFDGESEADYFLTSRVRVDIQTDIVPERILKALLSTVAARIVLNVRVARFVKTYVPVAQAMYGVTVMRTTGEARAVIPEKIGTAFVGTASVMAGSNLVMAFASSEIQPAVRDIKPVNALANDDGAYVMNDDGDYVLANDTQLIPSGNYVTNDNDDYVVNSSGAYMTPE